ncbi:hypothetical protein BV898_00502 [Hypsibius exemplaris]|uniref:Gustatory receptor n=1 Tax=Hypsibius exemplaris TaxID=2072580 RepID=A0A1W0XDK7_HYPEX|nr:hypothetical protein BV898_00502 [Hypsibius exemplaris]
MYLVLLKAVNVRPGPQRMMAGKNKHLSKTSTTNTVQHVDDIWVLQHQQQHHHHHHHQQVDTHDPPMELFDLGSRSSDIAASSQRSDQESQQSQQAPRDFSPRNHPTYPLIPASPASNHTSTGSPHRVLPGQVVPFHDLAAPFMAILRVGGLYFELDDAIPRSKLKRSSKHLPNGLPSSIRVRPRQTIMSRILGRGSEPSESLSFSLCSLSLITALIDDGRLIYAFWALWSAGQLTSLAFVVDNLVTIIWALQCLMVHCILMVMCYQKRFAELYDAWEGLRLAYPESSKGSRAFDFNQKFRRKQKILIGAGFAALLLNCYSLIGPLLIPIEVYQEFSEYVMFPFQVNNYAVKILIVVAFIFRSFDYVFTATLFLLLSDAIVLQFTLFYQDFADQISKDGVLSDGSLLEWHRLKHTKLCSLVKRVDAIFSPYVLLGLASGMFGILAQVYVIYDFLKKGDMNVITVLSYVYWSLLNLAQVLVILWCGSKVHVAALLPLPKLYEIDQRSLSVQETQHLTVFLQKLSNCQTGYTALGIFTIDMTTILSLAGFYFTYQILLFQMRNDSSLDDKLGNITLPKDLVQGLRDFLNLTTSSIASNPADSAASAGSAVSAVNASEIF